MRILRPVEFETLRDAMDPNTRRICTSLLLTGMRYAELHRFRENPDWLDGKFIYLPKGSMLLLRYHQNLTLFIEFECRDLLLSWNLYIKGVKF